MNLFTLGSSSSLFVFFSIQSQKCLPDYFRASPALRMQHEQSDSQLAVPNTRRGLFSACVNHARGNWQLASNLRRAKEVSGNFGDWATDRPGTAQPGHEWSLHFSGFVFIFFGFLIAVKFPCLSVTNPRNNQTWQLTIAHWIQKMSWI